MLKKILALLLSAALLFSLAFPVFAEEETGETEPVAETVTITISTAEDFLAFAENCRLDSYSENLVVELTSDISLTDTGFAGVPTFSGTFQGNGHAISGLYLTGDGSYQGLFRYLTESAVVEDLSIQGTLQPDGSQNYIGGLAGSNAGHIKNCSFNGILSGSEHIGGLVGTNKVSGIIENCQSDGIIHGEHFVGGIAGENLGVIRNCANDAQVNTTPQQNTVELSQITLDTLTSSENASTVTDIGGIAGSSGGVIRGCENTGTVGYRSMGYNVGGIAGSQTGYIVDCDNYGQIYGRKEVGGIVGHMEPVTNIVFTEDTLQILQGQLDTLGSLTDQATAHAQGSASAVTSQIAGIRDQTQNAMDAVEELFPTQEDPSLPDMDSLNAAQNALNSSFSNIQGGLNGIASSVQSTASTLSRDMTAISNQVKAMSSTINNAGENLGGAVTDISDSDTPEDITGKVEACENYGDVLGDLNVGGITGAIALENDLDHEADLQITGDASLNFDSELRAVVLSCTNAASVTASKQKAGGIAGWMSMGLAKDCLNTGTLSAENAAYVGGIAGQSTGFIRACSINCTITGSDYTGGIAGETETISDCRSMALLTTTERGGAIAGYAENREAITGNFYLPVNGDIGAIDGISYDGCAQPLAPDDFLALEDLETVFQTAAVTFRFEDGSTRRITVPYGTAIDPAKIPDLPEKEGCLAHWDGLTEEPLYFDLICTATYVSKTTVIQSDTEEGALPQLLAEGSFLPGAAITLLDAPEAPALEKGQTLLDTLAFTVSESATPITVRYRITQEVEEPQLLMQDENGQWTAAACQVEGSYLVFSAPSGETRAAIVEQSQFPWLYVFIAAGVVVLAVIPIIVKVRKKKPAETKQ